jgi:hypothetical protein
MANHRNNLLTAPVIFSMTILTACGGSRRPPCEPTPNGDDSAAANPASTPQSPEEIRTLWDSGAHADTQVLREDDQNEDCATCHDRSNWIPGQISSSAVRSILASSPATDTNSDEGAVTCENCHVGEPGEGEIAWLADPQMGEYDEISGPTQICKKCHLENGYEGHLGIFVMGPHDDFECVECHDSHDTTSSCTASGCHSPFAQECEPIQTHDNPHAEVTCSACHDATGMQIAWNEEHSAWDTFTEVSEDAAARFVTSHQLALEVDCDRCHEPGNHPWGN